MIYTTSPFVLPSKTIEIGTFSQSENSLAPSYSLTEYTMTMTTGISGSMEMALKGSYYGYNQQSSGKRSRDIDDIDLAFKWNFLKQPEDSVQPAVALIAGVTRPAKHRDLITSSVDHWASWIGIATGAELTWAEHSLGIYADTRAIFQDLAQEASKEQYYRTNMGILFPVSKYRNLQMLVEYSIVSGKDVQLITGTDYSAVTYGLRLVNERFNLSIGTQFLHKKADGFDDSSRVVGMMSFKI
ncbi:MAG: hypothetical protein OEW15_15850 [Nitrospirota bacterium]|nr:hypothetical protein [Nitrospirota bacterium]